MVNREVRSTSVPIAELLNPRIRSPSQCPGTARSSASAGRSLIMISGRTNVLPRPKARRQLPTQRTASLNVERLVNGFVRYPHGLIIGEVDP